MRRPGSDRVYRLVERDHAGGRYDPVADRPVGFRRSRGQDSGPRLASLPWRVMLRGAGVPNTVDAMVVHAICAVASSDSWLGSNRPVLLNTNRLGAPAPV